MASRVSTHDVDDLFGAALSFHEALGVYLEAVAPGRFPALAMPTATYTAFTIELFLKTFVALETGSTPHTHELAELFGLLAPATQAEISTAWADRPKTRQTLDAAERAAPGTFFSRNLVDHLALASAAFKRYRYAFDRTDGPLPPFFIAGLPEVLYGLLIQRRPDWANKIAAADPKLVVVPPVRP